MSFNKRLLSTGTAPFVASQNFKHITYSGNDAVGHEITGVGFKPDMVMIKPRNQTENWNIYDTTRGATKQLIPNSTAASTTQGQTIQSFDSDGFTLNGDNNVNKEGINYSAWCWKANGGVTSSNTDGSITSTVQANTAAGFSIVTWTGTGSNATIGHGLDSAPEWLVVKRTDGAGQDWVWKNDVALGAARGIYLNDSGCEVTDSTFWNSASANSTTFPVGTSDKTNGNGDSYIAYCWHSVSGFTNSTTGSQYTGTGDSNGPLINLGFAPSIIIIKSKDCSGAVNWLLYTKDTNEYLSIDNTNSLGANSGNYLIEFLSNGFRLGGNGAGINASGRSYNYYCWAEDPDEESPLLTNSFNVETYVGNAGNPRSVSGFGFSPDFLWIKKRNSADDNVLFDSVRGPQQELISNSTAAEATKSGDAIISFDTDGFTTGNNGAINANSDDYVSWIWKANDDEPTINTNGSIDSVVSVNDNAGFSIVSYTGDGNSSRTVGHGLSAKCDLVIIKGRDSADKWPVQLPQLGDNARMVLEGTAGKTDDSTTAQAGNATVFGIGGDNAVNKNGDRFIAYCFRNVTGYQKIGSYTGDGQTNQTITTGFKPDFIVIKSTVGNANWRIYDTRRGINNGFIRAHTNAAEHTDSDTPNLEIISTGFKITSGGVNNGVNANGNLYFYWAIAKNVPSNTTLADSFGVTRYTGFANARKIQGFSFRPDLVWIKGRSFADNHNIADTVRGSMKFIFPNLAEVEYEGTTTYLTSFDSNGFSLGTDNSVNKNTETFAAWGWKAGNTWQSNNDGTIPSLVNVNTAAGFSIVKYIGNGVSDATVGHGLSSAPKFFLNKSLGHGQGWACVHDALQTGYNLGLHNSNAETNSMGGDGGITKGDMNSTTFGFTAGTSGVNGSNKDATEFISYCWVEVSGFSKFGSYNGSGSSNSITGLGFRPDTLILKEIDGGDSWQLYDTVRGAGNVVYPNGNNAEYAGSELTSFDSDGFTVSGNSSNNESGKKYLYAAWKMNTTLNTTLENSFRNMPYTGTGAELAVTGAGFKPDLVWIISRDGTTWNNLFDSIRGPNSYLPTNSNSAVEHTANTMDSFDSDGFTIDSSNGFGNNNVKFAAWAWKAGNGYVSNFEGTIPSIVNANTANGFSIIRWEGTGAQGTIGHGLNSAPELIISKRIDSTNNWSVYHADLGLSHTSYPNWLYLNATSAEQNSVSNANHPYYQAPSSTLLYQHTGSSESTNVDGGDYISYCWHSVAGYSKIDEYTGTGTGTNQLINTGFQPDWVMFKDYSAGGSWFIVDAARGADESVKANSPDAAAETSYLTFESNGFRVTGDANATSDWVYMAFKQN